MKYKSVYDHEAMKRINSVLEKTGYRLSGGSVVGDTMYIGIDKGAAATVGDLGKRLKEALKVENLVLDGIPVR